ncbi:aminotransferase class V-fold PLP-dependent enzyme [Cyanobium sp. FACHB-13342]|uniref:aminotransferase class V-fold PLP-dependent enzyme n=1 Tax=Cyanobium sp. FACHB-13342 TaxID=2692793 RepID=UPI0016806515|nr:aminotransferase class V-fold PLP-dependent enzyme [Cyanobium sp. FACHB-13342]MBD2422693.1 aminotransferase class V-fold PLP-dependent enzyme [Cyanobium sp. FACHB-13342]
MAADFRALLPALANKTYFNYGGQGPLPTPSLQAITGAWVQIQELGPFTGAVWPFIEQTTGRLRQHLARWFGVPPHRLAFTENVTSGCVLPLWGLPWQPGDELLIGDCEHPGVVAACRELARRQGLQLATLPVADLRGSAAETDALVLERLEQRLTPATRLVVLSHLLWNTGQLMPISAVAQALAVHSRHPWLLVDGAQSLGCIPLAQAAAAADIYACTGHKWCCGPEGLGAVALSERVLEQAQPTLIGWRSLRSEASGSSGFHRDSRRFEVATSCVPLYAGLEQSLQLLEAEGSAEARLAGIQRRSQRLWQGLQAHPRVRPLLKEAPPAGLVSFELEGEVPEATVTRLGQQAIWLRSLDEPHCLRACTHITTTDAEIDQLLGSL